MSTSTSTFNARIVRAALSIIRWDISQRIVNRASSTIIQFSSSKQPQTLEVCVKNGVVQNLVFSNKRLGLVFVAEGLAATSLWEVVSIANPTAQALTTANNQWHQIKNSTLGITITITAGGSICFQVGNSYSMQNRSASSKMAITKWLLKTWKNEIIPRHKFLSCVPYGGDMNGEGADYRRKIYTKLGFLTDDCGGMVWTK